MDAFFSENLSTIIIGLIIFAAVVMIIVNMVKNRKKGKSSCGCGCSSCPSSDICHNK